MGKTALRDRNAVRAQHVLHAVLVAERMSDVAADALDVERITYLRERKLQLLKGPREAIHPPHATRDRADGHRELLRIEGVVHLVVTSDASANVGRNPRTRVCADDAERDLRHRREPLHVAVRVLEETWSDEDDVRHRRAF